MLQLPAPVLRDLKKLAAEVVREQSDEDADGPEGARVVHEVPGAGRSLGPRRAKAPTINSRYEENILTERRRFLVKAGGALAAVAAAAIVDAPNVIAQPKVKWRMPTTWTPALDVLQGSALRLAQLVEEMSGGRFRIEVSSAGQIMPPLGCLRRHLPGHRRGVHGLHRALADEGPGARVVLHRPVRHEPARA